MILALETSSSNCEISFLKEGEEVLSIFADTKSKHEKNLISFIAFGFQYLNITIKDISLIGISIGPGNFTSLRVGLATCFGLSYPHQIPVKGINTLDALYETLLSYFSEVRDKKVACVIDAKRDSLYTAIYQDGKRIGDYQLLLKEHLKTIFDKEGVSFVCGSGLISYPDLFVNLKNVNLYYPKAKIIGLMAKREKEKGNLDNLFSLSPFYLKEPDIRK